LETICRLGVEKCTNLVKLALRFIESSQKNVRKNAAQFIASAVQYPRFYTRLHKLHGTQILLEAIRWRESSTEETNQVDLSNELVEYTSEDILHALRQLVRSEMTLLAEYIQLGSFKAIDFCVALALDSESLATSFAILRAYCLQKRKLGLAEIFTHHYYGRAIDIIVQQDGFAVLTWHISAALRSHSSTVTQYALEILEVLTIPPVYHEKLVSLPSAFMVGDMDAVDDESSYSPEDGGALALIVRAAGPRFHREYLVVSASLRVICNLVHPKGWCPSSEYFQKYGISKNVVESAVTEDDGFNMQREAIRKSNGIRVSVHRCVVLVGFVAEYIQGIVVETSSSNSSRQVRYDSLSGCTCLARIGKTADDLAGLKPTSCFRNSGRYRTSEFSFYRRRRSCTFFFLISNQIESRSTRSQFTCGWWR